MAPPPLPVATAGLSYPLYACDFDPEDASTLVVGGGGGAGRSGVGNKITVLTLKSPTTLTTTAEIELSRDEDSVTSLAVGSRRADNLLVYAGINSSPADIKAGINQHFRTFAVSFSEKTTSISLLDKAALLPASHPEKYQRVLRLAAPGPEVQIAAAASGLGADFQVVLAELSRNGPIAPKMHGLVELKAEANDIDVLRLGDGEKHQLAYCTNHELFTVNFTPDVRQDAQPTLAYDIPVDPTTGSRPTIRCLRYLTPSFVLLLVNLPRRSGVVLNVIRIPTKAGEKGRLAATARLPRRVAQATALAVRLLAAPVQPGEKLGAAQFAIAVAGHDSSISLFTLEHQCMHDVDLVWDLLLVHTVSETHPLQITGLAFAPFVAPKDGAGPGALALASISMGNTISVHSLPLKTVVDKKAEDKKSRYALALKGSGGAGTRVFILLTVVVLLMALAGQALLESLGQTKDVLGVSKYINNPFQIRSSVAPLPAVTSAKSKSAIDTIIEATTTTVDAVVNTDSPSSDQDKYLAQFLSNIKAEHINGPIFLHEVTEPSTNTQDGDDVHLHGVSHVAAVLAGDEHVGKAWEEISEEQKALWKARLSKAGRWAEHMGESVFKGILFSELAAAVRPQM
ncbi:hypothetical protein TD95_000757 [Thielaviopsis punctulata]|uniref:Guanine nucleotide-exchange factor SEC12 n=1 Tax=Thielaviopsis punctulata TaxID=72032 RepID=A0A0F4Z8H5_9PEZI|nr:hypothetical protein TD95_000757 [Thielaviopsis punctulata]